MTSPELQLLSEVLVVRRDQGLLLHVPSTKRTLRVGRATETLLPALAEGTSFNALVALLGTPEVKPLLSAFLDKLRGAGMLAGGEAQAAPAMRVRLKPLVDINPLAGALATPLRALPAIVRRALSALVIAAAVAGIAALAWTHGRPHLSSVLYGFDAFALGYLLLIHMPIHELGHAVAARLAGIRITSAGVMFRRLGLPVPYVLTPEAFRLRERRPRLWIAAGGPLVDLVASGAAAWLAIAVDGPIGHAAAYFVFLGLVTLLLNLNPFVGSDGSHILQAALDDDNVRTVVRSRRQPVLTTPRAIRIYRIACLAYTVVMLVAMFGIWRLS